MRKAGLFALLVVAGCVSNHPVVRPLRPLEIATAPYQALATTTLTGTLMYEGGCLLFRDEESGTIFLPVFPTGSSFNGNALLFHLPGKGEQWLAVTQELLIYGHPIQWQDLVTPVYEPMQRQCGAYAPFFVANVRPAN
jgi:hypothetical protein